MPAPSSKPWADGPFELIPASRLRADGAYNKPGEKVKPVHKMAEEMLIVHNMILRTANSIYLQCLNVEKSPAVVPDFVGYAQNWAHFVLEHHNNEEMEGGVFEQIEQLTGQPGLMTGNREQHAAFHGGLDDYLAYTAAVSSGAEKYDGKKLRSLLEAFMPPLQQHLADEVADLMALDKYADKTDWAAWVKKMQQQIIASMQENPECKYSILPWFLSTHDVDYDADVLPEWPGLPWFPRMMIVWVFSRKYKGWWQFSPCDLNGKPQELPFVD